MLNDTLAAAVAVRKELRPTEDAVDSTLSQLGLLIHTACSARLKINAPAYMAQEPIEELANAAAMLSTVRGKIIAAHASLAQIHRDLMPTVGSGVDGCPPQKNAIEEPVKLRSVA